MPVVATGGDRVVGLFDGADVRPHDAVTAKVERLLGEELILLHAVGGNARGGSDLRCHGADVGDLAPVEQVLQAVAQRPDVPAAVFPLEHHAVIARLLQLHREFDFGGRKQRERVLTEFQRADDAVQAAGLRHTFFL